MKCSFCFRDAADIDAQLYVRGEVGICTDCLRLGESVVKAEQDRAVLAMLECIPPELRAHRKGTCTALYLAGYRKVL